jgi:hypothetical protein
MFIVIWCWSKKMQLVHFSPCQTSKHPFECSFLDYHMLKKTFSLNENMSNQFLQLMVIKTHNSIWSWTTYHHLFMFVVLMSNSMLLTNHWTCLSTWCKFQFCCHFHLLKLVIIVLLIYSSHCLVPTYNLTSPNSYCWFDFLGIMGVCARVALSSKYSNNYKYWDCL